MVSIVPTHLFLFSPIRLSLFQLLSSFGPINCEPSNVLAKRLIGQARLFQLFSQHGIHCRQAAAPEQREGQSVQHAKHWNQIVLPQGALGWSGPSSTFDPPLLFLLQPDVGTLQITARLLILTPMAQVTATLWEKRLINRRSTVRSSM